MNFVGIDISSKTLHIAILDGNGGIVELLKLESKKKESWDKLKELFDQFYILCESGKFNDCVICIERPIFIQNFYTSRTIVQVATMALIVLWFFGIQSIIDKDNKTWKKQVIGMGNATKQQIKEFVIQKWSIDSSLQQDFYDAIAIAESGRISENKR